MARDLAWWKRWGVGSSFDVATGDDVMLHRLRLVQTPWFGIYLHFIYREDRDRHMHDHPWHFTSLILRGGYIEEHSREGAPTHLRHWRRGSIHRMHSWKDAHRIVNVADRTVTLGFYGRKHRIWAFHTERGLVPWKAYFGIE